MLFVKKKKMTSRPQGNAGGMRSHKVFYDFYCFTVQLEWCNKYENCLVFLPTQLYQVA